MIPTDTLYIRIPGIGNVWHIFRGPGHSLCPTVQHSSAKPMGLLRSGLSHRATRPPQHRLCKKCLRLSRGVAR